MADETIDLTMRTDRGGNMVKGKRGEYVCNIAQMLFNTKPGTDEYEPAKGLYIAQKQMKPYEEKERDSAYESEIVKQFNQYTELRPINVMAMYLRGSFFVYMTVKYEGELYEIHLTYDSKSLTAVLQ